MVLPSFLSPVHRKLAEKLSGIGTLTKLITKTASCEDMRCQARITVAVQYQIRTGFPDRKSTRLNSSHSAKSRMPSSA